MQVTGDNATDRLINTQLAETVPFGWTVTENDSTSMIFSGATPNYAWQDTTGELATGDILTIVYDVTIPELEEAGEKSITGAVSAIGNFSGDTVGDTIGGDTTVNVTEEQHNPITYISPGDSLQEAVDNAEPWDTIMMAPGIYTLDADEYGEGVLSITKPLHFEAEGGVVVWQGCPVEEWGPQWEIIITYYGSLAIGAYWDGSHWATVDASGTTFKGITFGNNNIDDNYFGNYLTNNPSGSGYYNNVTYENCIFTPNARGEWGEDDQMWYVASNSSVINCTFTGDGTSRPSMCLTSGGSGAGTPGASNVLFENNSGLRKLWDNLASSGGSNLTLRNNNFTSLEIVLPNSYHEMVVENNTFVGGSLPFTSATNIIRYNEFRGGSISLGGKAYLNNFINCAPTGSATFNTSEMVTYTYGGTSHTGYLGNYYSGYAGNDTNRDGVGEDAYGNDIYPLMGEWNDGEIACDLPPQPVLSFVPSDATVIDGQTTEIVISVDSLPAGLSGYNFTVDIGDRNVSNIVNITYPEWVTMGENSTLPRGSIYLKALDGNETIQAGATDVELATITAKGRDPGITNFTLTIDRLDDDTGEEIDAILEIGTLEVTMTPVPGQTVSPKDLDGDRIYEDLTGDGSLSFTDVEVFFHQMDWMETNLPIENFDFNGNGRIDFDDVVDLFQMVV
jgi:PKD repeat protein